MALLEHDAARAVDDVGRHLEAAVRRQAVQEPGVGRGGVHQRLVDGEALEGSLALLSVDLLAHRHPGVGVHEGCAGDGLERTVGHVDVAEPAQPGGLGVVPLVANWAGQPHPRPEQQARLGQRAGDVVVVADVGDLLGGESPPTCSMVNTSASACNGWARSDSRLTTGTVATSTMRSSTACSKTRAASTRVVALEDPGDVLDRLARVEADLVRSGVDGMAAELHHGHLGRVPGAGRRLLEDAGPPRGHRAAGSSAASGRAARSSTVRSSPASRSTTSRRCRSAVTTVPVPPWRRLRRSRRR